ncbi:hypothetical protein EHQ58_17250 [Leptospira ognonensis]|uniref:Lipoprotein n=1 Tax=Leptospira ognonensis TaxID=2484945 RepID=A0A4V3JQM2_9LEPT|nr:hypothetical protein [Leptospira ognonensis]TGL56375.1 hypothetical protein EHQ58_17250 [Leptospira ognonensis]
MKKIIFLIIWSFTFSGCIISYRDYPKLLPIPEREKVKDAAFVYNLPNFPQFNLGGREALKNYFDKKTPFKSTVEGVDVPKSGYLVNVKVDYRSPSKPALVFLGLSTVTATLLPAWSEQDGYDIAYHLYKDGKPVKVYEYHLFRNYGQWLPLILGIWYNGETATEKEVFERITDTFFEDAKEYF